MSTGFDYIAKSGNDVQVATEVTRKGLFHDTGFDERSDASSRHFSADVLNAPMFEGKDIAGLIGAAIMTLGPLAAYSFGFGA